jgi:hypothetical protein
LKIVEKYIGLSNRLHFFSEKFQPNQINLSNLKNSPQMKLEKSYKNSYGLLAKSRAIMSSNVSKSITRALTFNVNKGIIFKCFGAFYLLLSFEFFGI